MSIAEFKRLRIPNQPPYEILNVSPRAPVP